MLTPQEVITSNTELASPPDIYLKITSTLDDPSKKATDLAKIIELDPGLSTRILHLVNSAFYGFSVNIISISHAASVIGANELRNLVLTTVVVDRFSKLPNALITMDQFWTLSVKCALFARSIGKHQTNKAEMEAIYICGLLHRIGLIIIYNKLPELALAAIQLSESHSIPESEAQDEIIGFNYAEVGAALAIQWKLPTVIGSTLQHQFEPEKSLSHPIESAVITLSRQLSEIDISDEKERSQLIESNGKSCSLTKLNPERLNEAISEVDLLFSEAFRMIYQP